MALSLGVKTGSQMRIGSSILRVLEIKNYGRLISIEVGNRRFLIDDEKKTEILPAVFVFCGVTSDWCFERKSKIAFDAPRSIQIDRVKDEASE